MSRIGTLCANKPYRASLLFTIFMYRTRARSAVDTARRESDMNQKPLRTWTVRDTLRNPPLHTHDGSGLRRRLMVKQRIVKHFAIIWQAVVSLNIALYDPNSRFLNSNRSLNKYSWFKETTFETVATMQFIFLRILFWIKVCGRKLNNHYRKFFTHTQIEVPNRKPICPDPPPICPDGKFLCPDISLSKVYSHIFQFSKQISALTIWDPQCSLLDSLHFVISDISSRTWCQWNSYVMWFVHQYKFD